MTGEKNTKCAFSHRELTSYFFYFLYCI